MRKAEWVGRQFFLLMLLARFSAAYGQHIPLSFKSITIEQGLSSNNVTCIAEDSLGYIWFGGPQGLNRYNGYNIRQYYSDASDPQSLADSHIISLFCDDEGRIWAGTRTGVSVFQPTTNRFTSYPFFTYSLEEANNRLVNQIKQSPDGAIWLVTENGTFWQYNQAADSIEQQPVHLNEQVQVKSFYFDTRQDSLLWIGSNQGLIRYDMRTHQYQIIEIANMQDMVNMSVNINGILPKGPHLWLAIYRVGIVRLDTTDFSYQVYPLKGTNKNYLLSAHKDRNGRLWFASGGGLFLYHSAKDEFIQYGHRVDKPGSLNVSGVACLFHDSHGNYWVGTNEGGVNLSWGASNFTSYEIDPFEQRHLPEKSVNGLMKDDQGHLWVAYSNGIDVYNKDMQVIHTYPKENQKPENQLGDGAVWKTIQDADKRIWVTTYTGGLQEFVREKDAFINYPHTTRTPPFIAVQDIRDIALAPDSSLWLANHGHGFSHFYPETGQFQHFTIDSTERYLNWTNCILHGKGPNIWLGTMTGLFLYNKRTRTSTPFIYEPEDTTSLSNNIINTLFADSRQRLWIGTTQGLNLFQEKDSGFIRLGIRDGLPNDNICAIEEDTRGRLWVSTRGGGLFRFHPDTWLNQGALQLAQYTQEDGLQSNEFSAQASFQDAEGYLYFGGVNGFSRFHPDSIRANTQAPKVIISTIRLFNQTIYPNDEPFEQLTRVNNHLHLRLKHNQNMLAIQFTAFNYRQPEQNQYRYTLNGFDNQWYPANASREAVYTNLPAGKYTFHVIASNNDGVWNRQGVKMHITILPPWWQTTAFRILVLLFITGSIYAFFMWRIRAIKKQRNELEHMVQKKTAQLKKQNKEIQEMAERVHEADQSKIRFFMNISHEFRTPLSLIIGPLKKMLAQDELSQDIKNQLKFMNRSAYRLLRLINQLLDMQKLDLKKLTLQVTENDVVAFMQSIFYLFEFSAREKSISYTFHFDEILRKRNLWFDKDALEKIIFNLLSNAFKHTPEGGEVSVYVNWRAKNMQLELVVEDTGSGIPAEKLPHIFNRYFSHRPAQSGGDGIGIGLTLVKELVHLHKGTIAVNSREGVGTRFTVHLPAQKQLFTKQEATQSPVKPTETQKTQRPDQAQATAAETSSVPVKYPFRILLAEDDEDLLQFLTQDMRGFCQLQTATNGLDAWKACQENTPDLLVSDIMMPGMDGITLCKHIKTDDKLSDLPVVLLTAKSEDSDRISGYETGADAYLTKPFSPELLKVRIVNLIESRKKLRERFDQYPVMRQRAEQRENEDQQFLNQAIAFVESHLANPQLGHKDLAGALHVSKSTLYRKISELTGYSIHIFIRIIRLNNAARLLQEQNTPVSEVAYQTGFNDPNYFSKCFKEHFQLSPRDYQASQGNHGPSA